MSEIVAVGPALDLEGPLPGPPEYSLLTLPGVVKEDGARWLNGVNVFGYPCGVPLLWEPCSEGTFRTKSEESEMPVTRFDSFAVIQPLTCSAIGMGNPEEYSIRAERALEATQSFGVEEALSQGVTGSANPFLGDGNVTVLGGGAVSLQTGLSLLENAIGETGRAGMIHAAPAVASGWSFDGGLVSDGRTLKTWLGTPVVSGGGYIGAEADGNAPAAGNAWAFATGPVEVRLASVSTLPIRDVLERETNVVTFRAERYALAIWDTCLQVAVEVDYTTT